MSAVDAPPDSPSATKAALGSRLSAGLVSAGVITVGVMGLNGMLLGWIVGKQLSDGQGDALVSRGLPHLPLELLAYVVTAGATLRLAVPFLSAQAVAVGLLLVGVIVEANFSYV